MPANKQMRFNSGFKGLIIISGLLLLLLMLLLLLLNSYITMHGSK